MHPCLLFFSFQFLLNLSISNDYKNIPAFSRSNLPAPFKGQILCFLYCNNRRLQKSHNPALFFHYQKFFYTNLFKQFYLFVTKCLTADSLSRWCQVENQVCILLGKSHPVFPILPDTPDFHATNKSASSGIVVFPTYIAFGVWYILKQKLIASRRNVIVL